MTRLMKTSWLLMALLLLGLTACGGNATAVPTTDPNLVYTQIWQTVEAAQTETALVMPPTEMPTSTLEPSPTLEMTNTPLITDTSQPGAPTNTPFSLPTAVTTQQTSCDNATFIADVTIPDGTVVKDDTGFVKTWSVKNTGPCTWDQDYKLVFGWGGVGTNWNTAAAVYFTEVVLPGESLEISISLLAPDKPGNYAAAFRLQNDKGFNFGPSLTVVVEVK
jgi:hypothetical protein